MAETSYRRSAAGKAAAIPAGGDGGSFRERASAPAPLAATALTETFDVANWTMAEASYRKSTAVFSPVSQSFSQSIPQSNHTAKSEPATASRHQGAVPYAEVSPTAARSSANALAALRRDLKAGAVVQTAAATAAIRDTRNGAAIAGTASESYRKTMTGNGRPGGIDLSR